eukprot:Stramenopile-MAST_4_protein_3107
MSARQHIEEILEKDRVCESGTANAATGKLTSLTPPGAAVNVPIHVALPIPAPPAAPIAPLSPLGPPPSEDSFILGSTETNPDVPTIESNSYPPTTSSSSSDISSPTAQVKTADSLDDELTPEEQEEKLYVDRIVRKMEEMLTSEIVGQRLTEDMVQSVRVERDFYHDTLQAIEKAILKECRADPKLATSHVAENLISMLKST